MMEPVTRRDALRGLAIAGATLLFKTRVGAQRRRLEVAGTPVELRVASLSDRTVRITIVPSGERPPNADGALVDFAESQTFVPDGAARIKLGTAGNLTVTIATDPIQVTVADGDTTVQEIRVANDGGVTFLLGDRPVLGFGEGGPQFDRRGDVDRMRNGQGGYQLRTHGGRVPIQWLIGTGGWGLYIHQPLGTFDLSGAQGILAPERPLPLDVFVVSSTDPAVIMREYARITGLPEMPPLWSFGYQQSHRTLAGPEEVMWVANTMREKKLPCDALIYLGTDFTPSGWNTHNGEFTWNEKNFPDPKGTIDRLHGMHYKVVLHTVIEGKRLTGTVRDACAAPEPSGRTPDGEWPDDRHVGCYWPYHKGVYDLGIDGWWPDQGDGLDAASRLTRIRMYWEGSQLWRPNERPYALHRNGYAGMQRYAPFLWSGDVYSTWETLRTHVPVAINTSLSGIPYWGTDIGGFVPTPEFTGELYVRWFQFGAFCTLFRSHGRTWHLRLPWGWNTGEVGPDETSRYRGAGNPPESELHNAQVEPICRKFMELRYRLLPYLYSAVREAHLTGMPIMRAMWLHHPDDPQAVARGDQYFWGPDLLVAPVVEQGATTRRVYLPRGAWFDYWTEKRVDGGTEVSREVDLSVMPIYARAGAVLPLGPVRQYVDEPVEGALELIVFPGRDGRLRLYEDDGRSFAYRRGDWMGITANWRDADRRLTLTLTPGSRMRGGPRRIDARLAGSESRHAITFRGGRVDVRL
ncbi:MAG TPA: TIM-barrel domain-containing protein [Vicinamibacterales bacterium]|nr:TIM-barrel domain-containing protein [Vicinamibacterales bacterium]